MARLLGSLTCDCWRPTLDERRNVNPREPCRVGIHKTPPQDSEHTQPCVWRGSPGPAAENPASRPRCHSKLAPFRSKATPALRHRPCLLCPLSLSYRFPLGSSAPALSSSLLGWWHWGVGAGRSAEAGGARLRGHIKFGSGLCQGRVCSIYALLSLLTCMTLHNWVCRASTFFLTVVVRKPPPSPRKPRCLYYNFTQLGDF